MLGTLSRRTAFCQSVAQVYLIGVVPLGTAIHRFNFFTHEDVTRYERHLRAQQERIQADLL